MFWIRDFGTQSQVRLLLSAGSGNECRFPISISDRSIAIGVGRLSDHFSIWVLLCIPIIRIHYSSFFSKNMTDSKAEDEKSAAIATPALTSVNSLSETFSSQLESSVRSLAVLLNELL